MIKNIILDMGGVIVDIDYRATINAFLNLGAQNLEDFFAKDKQSHIIDLLEIGQITPAQFRKTIKEHLRLEHITDQQFNDAWDAVLLSFFPNILSQLQKLKQQYRLFLFSNANALHEKRFNTMLKDELSLDSMDDYFEKIYFSHRCGFRKPHPASFLKIIAMNELDPTETLFVDDTKRHIIGAHQAGLHAIHITEGKSIFDLERLIAATEYL